MIGIPGSGKSFFAEHFSKSFNAPIVSHDKIRKTIFEDITFSKDEERIVTELADYFFEELLKTKLTIVYDGAILSPTERRKLAKKASDNGYQPLFVWSQAENSIAQKRSTKTRGNDNPISQERFDQLVNRFIPPSPQENYTVISGMHTHSTQLRAVLKKLATDTVSAKPPMPEKTSTRSTTGRRFLIR